MNRLCTSGSKTIQRGAEDFSFSEWGISEAQITPI